MLGLKRHKQVDERLLNLQNKIYKEIYFMIMCITIISIIVKFIVYGVGSKFILTELIILIITGLYYMVRAGHLGIFTDEAEMHDRNSKIKLSTKNVIVGLIIGIFISVILATSSAINYANSKGESIYFFIIVFIASFMMYVPFFVGIISIPFLITKKKSDQVVRKGLEDIQGEWK
ncbi:DUF6773 family protein [Cytobacillus sp. IB215665]|uniref:DUF6773 family protein n=1 Tax=Cytobacillus sp. IB215665 TaxID=3097357 RepID=UPI002A14DACA|nr:DUF6773 family protein [Cytobacillus sp. IB215665]MDX8367086.1 DUF6773 family protein [Cytobacillus sp. IB215665]